MWIVKHTDFEGEEEYSGPFNNARLAYTWASDRADRFLASKDDERQRWSLDADGEFSVSVEQHDKAIPSGVSWELFQLKGT